MLGIGALVATGCGRGGAGVAVWDPEGSPRVTAIELAGGDVRGAVNDPYAGDEDEAQGVKDPDSVEGTDEDAREEDPGPDDEGVADDDGEEPDAGLLYGVQPCVRA